MQSEKIYRAEFTETVGDPHLLSGRQAVDYILAGRGAVTVLNTESGNHFSFGFGRPADVENGSGPVFVRALYRGDEYLAEGGYLGAIWDRSRFVPAGKRGSDRRRDTEEFYGEELSAWSWSWDRILTGRLPASVQLWHSGECGRCGRRLTDPVSIERGFGPDCAEALGMLKKAGKARAAEIISELGF